jgi:hypothetical protein
MPGKTKRNPGFVEGAIRTFPASKRICLVRRDGYVAMTADADGRDEVHSYLDRWAKHGSLVTSDASAQQWEDAIMYPFF